MERLIVRFPNSLGPGNLTRQGRHLKGFSLSSGHLATWLYGNRTFLSFSLSKGSGGKFVFKLASGQSYPSWSLSPARGTCWEPGELLFCSETCNPEKKEITKVQWGSADVDVTLKTQDLYFNSNCQWVHLVSADNKHKWGWSLALENLANLTLESSLERIYVERGARQILLLTRRWMTDLFYFDF